MEYCRYAPGADTLDSVRSELALGLLAARALSTSSLHNDARSTSGRIALQLSRSDAGAQKGSFPKGQLARKNR